MRNLVLVLGDQLSLTSVAFEGFDAARDRVWMAEVPRESNHVPSTKMRTALFLSAMRHFGAAVACNRMALDYLKLGAHRFESLDDALSDALLHHRPEAVVMAEAGEWRIEQLIAKACASVGVRLVVATTSILWPRAPSLRSSRGGSSGWCWRLSTARCERSSRC